MFWSTSYLASVSLHNLTENENMFCSIKINFHIRLFWSGNFSVISMSLWKINLEEIISFLYNHTCAVYCRLLIFPGKELIILMAFMLSLSRFILKGQSIEVFFFFLLRLQPLFIEWGVIDIFAKLLLSLPSC